MESNQMLLLLIVILGAIYFMGENDDDEDDEKSSESVPVATFFVQEDSSGIYHVDVVKVSRNHSLEGFSFYLKDEEGEVYLGGNGFGEIAMQIIAGDEHGIDVSYSNSCGNNCDSRLENRVGNVSNDDGSEYPVHFSDNDRDGKLSAGDSFIVYGQGHYDGPAEDNWRLEIQFDASGDIIGSAKML